MPTFDRFDVVSVPFPYTDRPVRERRPALIVSVPAHEERTGMLWVVMITSAQHRPWPGDVRLADHARVGLSIPSMIRTAKIATVEARDARKLGRPSAGEIRAVRAALAQILG
jgi:mRNA interferase MazF